MIEKRTDSDQGLTEFVCTESLTFEEVTGAISEFYGGEPTAHVMWDITDASLSSVKAQEVRGTALHATNVSHSRIGGKTALVGGGDMAYGMARMYKAFADTAGQESEIQIFRTRDQALAWLAGEKS